MNGRAWSVWVIEIRDRDGQWKPGNGYPTRYDARRIAGNIRDHGWRTRIRQYIRQPEVRP